MRINDKVISRLHLKSGQLFIDRVDVNKVVNKSKVRIIKRDKSNSSK